MAGKQTIPTKVYAADFETVTYPGQTTTAVWLAGFVELYTEEPFVCGNIRTFIDTICHLGHHVVMYFHNLKFDGSFILDYLIRRTDWKQAYDEETNRFLKPRDMPHKSFTYSINDMGQWYRITLKYRNCHIEFRDSFKLLPMALRKLAKDFRTKHQKLDMQYKGMRYPDCPVKPNEMEYFKGDLYVLKEALEVCYNQGHTKLTIGSCCMEEFKRGYPKYLYKSLFPNLYKVELNPDRYNALNVGEYIRKCYAGAWCYAVKGKAGRVLENGITCDVNSLYPYVMGSWSGNIYPTGEPHPWFGNYIPEDIDDGYLHPKELKGQWYGYYYYVTVKCRFKLKEGALPWIHIRNNMYYSSKENLTSSYPNYKGKPYKELTDKEGNLHTDLVTLHLSCTDYHLMLDTYDLTDLRILHGMWFEAQSGLFDDYLAKYRQIKETSTGAQRTLAKLFSNNLYGKLAATPDSDFKLAFEDEENRKLSFKIIEAQDKEPGYIADGAAITSYAKNWTIRHAIANYHGSNKGGFAYADTDSMHLDNCTEDDLIDVEIHHSKYGAWKIESAWARGLFVRQKTYIEELVEKDGEVIEVEVDGEKIPYHEWNITCSGMSARCKEHFIRSLEDMEYTAEDIEKLEITEREQNFVKHHREITDFAAGLHIPGALKAKIIDGGTILYDGDFTLK